MSHLKFVLGVFVCNRACGIFLYVLQNCLLLGECPYIKGSIGQGSM